MSKFCGGCGTSMQDGQKYCHECSAANEWGNDEPTLVLADTADRSPLEEKRESDDTPLPQEQPIQLVQSQEGNLCTRCQAPVEGGQEYCRECTEVINWDNNSGDFLYSPYAYYPVPSTWKTSWGFSILGLFIGAMFPPFWVLAIPYAAIFYPSYFTEKPKLKSNRVISFANCAFGGPIFGWIWNGNLRIKDKGISHIVFIVLTVLMFAFMTLTIIYEDTHPVRNPVSTEVISPANRVHPDTSIIEVDSTGMTGTRTYIDNMTGATFQVPSSWIELPNDDEDPFADILFHCEEGKYFVSYWSSDYWNLFPIEDRRGIEPSDVDNSFLPPEKHYEDLIAATEGHGISIDGVEVVTFGDNTFYKTNLNSASLDVPIQWLVIVSSGFEYLLQFQGLDEHHEEFAVFAASLTLE